MMETSIIYSREKNNNLELYLNDVYEKECVFKIEKEEIEFIQTGIETLVQEFVDKILADDSFHKLISDHIDKSPFLTEELYHKKSIAEVYFPIQSESSLQRYVAENKSQVKTVKRSIMKVGSSYDGTKNNFSNESDFIFPLLGIRTPLVFRNELAMDLVKVIGTHAKCVRYTSPDENHELTSNLVIVKVRGPAYKLEFIYHYGSGQQRHKMIRVDLVPAFRIIDSNTLKWFVEYVGKYVVPETFRNEILAAESSLIVRQGLAFTEIEQHFMKNILSKKHVKVYRILKYLINGHGDGENLEELISGYAYYSSYHTKILIIYHHEACTNTDAEALGPCVLQVLDEMSKYESIAAFPSFRRKDSDEREFQTLPFLKSAISTLRSMRQTSEIDYCYERDKQKSVTGQYLDYLLTEVFGVFKHADAKQEGHDCPESLT